MKNQPGTMKNHEKPTWDHEKPCFTYFLRTFIGQSDHFLLQTLFVNRTPLIQKTLCDEHRAFKKVLIFLYKQTLFVDHGGSQTTFSMFR